MKNYFRHAAIAVALAITSVGAMTTSYAQDDILNKIVPSVEYQNADFIEALKALFKPYDASYALNDPTLQGQVTLNLKNARFELVLQNLLAQVDATYRYEGGIFVIVRKETAPVVDPSTGDTSAPASKKKKIRKRIPINRADPQLIAILIGQSGQQWLGSPEPTSLSRMGGMGGGMMGGMGGMMGHGRHDGRHGRRHDGRHGRHDGRHGRRHDGRHGRHDGRHGRRHDGRRYDGRRHDGRRHDGRRWRIRFLTPR